jgi:UDP-GlcNAc:undecaprenyl-phosphate/decaprenyl-phosphate GlcNAc-1-phosphate transferase
VIYLSVAVAAAALALLLAPGVRAVARRWGIVDVPGRHGIHSMATPRVGGIAVALAVMGAMALVAASGQAGAAEGAGWWPALLGGLLVLGVGLWDDVRAVSPAAKLIFQVSGAAVAMALGVRISHVSFFGTTYALGPLALPLTLLWIVGLTNAFNLVDGLDGLATGLAIIAAGTCATVSILRGDSNGGLLLMALFGALGGFLPYNFNPATIFLGDSGSLAVGYLLAVTSITSSQKGATALAVAVPLLIFALPIAETLLSIARRMRGQGLRHVFSADRQHIHHRLLDRGFSQRRAALLLCAVSLFFAIMALATMQIP